MQQSVTLMTSATTSSTLITTATSHSKMPNLTGPDLTSSLLASSPSVLTPNNRLDGSACLTNSKCLTSGTNLLSTSSMKMSGLASSTPLVSSLPTNKLLERGSFIRSGDSKMSLKRDLLISSSSKLLKSSFTDKKLPLSSNLMNQTGLTTLMNLTSTTIDNSSDKSAAVAANSTVIQPKLSLKRDLLISSSSKLLKSSLTDQKLHLSSNLVKPTGITTSTVFTSTTIDNVSDNSAEIQPQLPREPKYRRLEPNTSQCMPIYSSFKQVDEESQEALFVDDTRGAGDKQERLYKVKMALVRQVSCALSKKVQLDRADDPTRGAIVSLAEEVAMEDGEFILKMALHTRREMNLRTVSNLLLALACLDPNARPYLSKYFSAAVVLPSDWIAISDLVQTFGRMKVGSLPAGLRRAMVNKFEEFDEYQLAKHNKTPTKRKIDDVVVPDDDCIVEENDFRRRHTDLKRLVRTLHISRPVNHVMCILGKKYPDNELEFKKSKLLGVFDPELAGKRMKLKTPITWETQISERGSKAEVWEELIFDKKLPYMASLRNLRNLVMAGVSDKAVKFTSNYLCNEAAVRTGKQLPTQYLSALKALDDLQEMAVREFKDYKPSESNDEEVSRIKYTIEKLKARQGQMNKGAVSAFKTAVEKALEVSAKINIPPIKGQTKILWDVGDKKSANVFVAMLCKSAESVDLFYTDMTHFKPSKDLSMNGLIKAVENAAPREEPSEDIFNQTLGETWMDNLIVINCNGDFSEPIKQYRETVNENLVFVNVTTSPVDRHHSQHPNDVHLSGFSDQIFHSLAATCSGGQLERIECVDKRFNLASGRMPASAAASDEDVSEEDIAWPRLRVFVSSTFDDMHGERDLIHRYIFPELRRRCRGLRLDIVPIDLRWGLDESTPLLASCLDAIDSCQLFVGILGDRFGHVPGSFGNDRKMAERLGFTPTGAESITELEMRYALSRAQSGKITPFFYLRNSAEIGLKMPAYLRPMVFSGCTARLDTLKSDLIMSGHEVFVGYPATYEGHKTDGGKPVIQGLESLGQRMLANLWNGAKTHTALNSRMSEDKINGQLSFVTSRAQDFVGRQKLLGDLALGLNRGGHPVNLVCGQRPGVGVTSLMAAVIKTIDKKWNVIPYFHDSPSSCSNLTELLRYLYGEVCRVLAIKQHKGTKEFYSKSLATLLSDPEAPVCLIIDGLEYFDEGEQFLQIIPNSQNKNFKLILSGGPRSKLDKAMETLKPWKFQVGHLDYQDKKTLAKAFLARFGKSLQETGFNNQLAKVTGKRDASNVAYLQLLCQELSAYGTFENLDSHLCNIGDSYECLLQQIIDRAGSEHLVQDVVRLIYCGEKAVSVCGPIAALSADDLQDILTAPDVSLALTGLEPFLQPIEGSLLEGRLLLKSGVPFKVLDQRFELAQGQEQNHADIARLLRRRYDEALTSDASKPVDAKIVRALPYHLWQAGDLQALETTVCDLEFVQLSSANFKQLMFYLGCLNSAQGKIYATFLKKNADVIDCDPCLTIQQALQHQQLQEAAAAQLRRLPRPKAALVDVGSGDDTYAWVESAQHLGISSQLTCVAVEPTRRHLDPSKRLAAFGFANGSVAIALAESTSILFILNGMGSPVTAMAFYQGAEDDSILMAGSETGQVTFWNVNERAQVGGISPQQSKGTASAIHHTRRVTGVAASCSGLTAVSVSLDGQTLVWNGRGGKLLYRMPPPANDLPHTPINDVCFLPKMDTIVTSNWDGTVRQMSLAHKTLTKSFECPGPVQSVRVSGRTAVFLSLTGHIDCLNNETVMWSKVIDGAVLVELSDKLVYVYSRQGIVYRLGIESGDELGKSGCREGVVSMDLLAQDRLMMSTCQGEVQILDLAKMTAQPVAHKSSSSYASAAAGSMCEGGRVLVDSVWHDVCKSRFESKMVLLKGGERVRAAKVTAVATLDRWVATASDAGLVKLWKKVPESLEQVGQWMAPGQVVELTMDWTQGASRLEKAGRWTEKMHILVREKHSLTKLAVLFDSDDSDLLPFSFCLSSSESNTSFDSDDSDPLGFNLF